MVAYIAARIIHLFILSSAVQMYEFSYIHFSALFLNAGHEQLKVDFHVGRFQLKRTDRYTNQINTGEYNF